MSSKNSMNANKNFNKEASPQSKTKKLKKKLGPQWTKDELERFYEAYQKHGRDWKKVAASVENNRSVDMVEALFSMNQPYLSLPEASVDGLAAIMTAHYNLFEESESKGEGHDASGVTRGFPIKKLHDAEDLDKQCTLILTEGDSAKHLVMAGLSSLQRKTYGFILCKVKNRNGVEAKSFYSMAEYSEWKEQQEDNLSKWETTHYKVCIKLTENFWERLGTHTSEEGCEYFKHIDNHKRVFVCDDDKDHGEAIDGAFNANSKYRKEMLENFDPNSHHHETEARQITFTDFIEKDLASFFMANMKRSVPSMLDGLKPDRERYFIACLRGVPTRTSRSPKSLLFEKALNNTIIKMAQQHVGSNNLPLLQSLGQFGTRIAGGQDAADPRYLRTKLSQETRILFPKEDDKYADAHTGSLNDEDRKNTEPTPYYPIVPMVLVNGCRGIASGWSTFIPNYKLKDVISNVERLLNDEKTEPMDPWYEGFEGTITKDGENRYKTFGRLEESSGNAETRLVTELPIEVWTNNYVSSLDKGKENRGKVSAFIENYLDRSNDTTVSIQIELKKTEKKMTPEEEKEILGLTTMLSTGNMYLFDENDMIKKYESPQEIIEDFYEARLKAYDKRKKHMLMELEEELKKLQCIVAFVTDVMNGEFKFDIKRSRAQLYEEVKGKYEATGRGLTDYSFLLDLSFLSCSKETLQDLQDARENVNRKIIEVETLTPKAIWKSELQKLRDVTEISMSSKLKRTRSPGSTSSEKERKR
ncbi:hypothetical protein Bca52824_005526 [Brassica carinata]|uniref:DNA topoisomerase (ATP-hydrolyzing) n=1 Tax=Brassica carinata TaxID=52824 RepID=A0A8X7WQZ8_BRACI|nr:hypothetical protein Bca52824_005526 [Brassica carinata]